MPHNCDHYARINYPLQAQAFDLAWEIMDGRDGAGFIFEVHTEGGHVFTGPPPSTGALTVDKNGILAIEIGDKVALITHRSITAIVVVEC